MNLKRRENLAKAIYDIGKFSFAALVIGQFVSDKGFNPLIFIGGVIFSLVMFWSAYVIDK